MQIFFFIIILKKVNLIKIGKYSSYRRLILLMKKYYLLTL